MTESDLAETARSELCKTVGCLSVDTCLRDAGPSTCDAGLPEVLGSACVLEAAESVCALEISSAP